MQNVVRILSCQLALCQVGVGWDVAIMLAAGALEAIQGPILLELLLGATKLP